MIELDAGRSHLSAAVCQTSGELIGHAFAVVGRTHGRQSSALGQVQSQATQGDQNAQSTEIEVVVLAVAVFGPRGLGQDALGFVETDGAWCHADPLSQIRYFHATEAKPSSA